MRIAIVSDFFYPELSGVTDSIAVLGAELSARGHKVMFLVPRYSRKNYKTSPNIDAELGENIRVSRMPSIHLPGSPTGQSRIVLPTGAGILALKRFRPDIVYTNSPYVPGLETFAFSRIFGIPLVGTHHTPMSEFISGPAWFVHLVLRYASWYYNRCEYVTAPCQSLLDEMEQYGLRSLNSPMPNPIDLTNFVPPRDSREKEELKRRFKLSGHTVLYTGRLAVEKHVDVIIRALAIAQKTITDISLVVTGHGGAEGQLRELVAELGLQEKVLFPGFVEKETFPLLYKASDLFVIMSTAESQSLSLMQAMSSGLPVIGARARALPEYITSQNGVVVEPGDFDRLAEEMVRILSDAKLAAELGRGGIQSVQAFAPEIITGRWEKVFFKAIGEKAGNIIEKSGNTIPEVFKVKAIQKVSVVIPAHNEEKNITNTIEAVLAQDYPDFEIIVVDNASTDSTSEIAGRFAAVKVVHESNKGLLWARERGRQEATGDIIVNIDADCLPEKDWLSRGIAPFAREDVSAVSGPYDYYDGGSIFRHISLLTQRCLYYPIGLFLQLPFIRGGAVMIGGNNFIRASVLEKTGGYNTALTFYGEDTDTAKRVSRYGRVVFKPGLAMKTSARRFKAEGTFSILLKYWFYFFKHIFTSYTGKK